MGRIAKAEQREYHFKKKAEWRREGCMKINMAVDILVNRYTERSSKGHVN